MRKRVINRSKSLESKKVEETPSQAIYSSFEENYLECENCESEIIKGLTYCEECGAEIEG